MLTEKEVRHVAKLARIALSDEEVKRYSSQLSEVLDYMDILKEVDTEGVKETSQVTGLNSVLEVDEIKDYEVAREDLLGCTELEVDSNQIKVKSVL